MAVESGASGKYSLSEFGRLGNGPHKRCIMFVIGHMPESNGHQRDILSEAYISG